MGKKTIKEAVSKVIYDRSVDPADVEIVIIDSDKIRRIPFNFVEFFEDGFFYKGNFYPLYKILAIENMVTGERYIDRNRPNFEVLKHEGIEFGEFAYNILSYYQPFTIIRHRSIIAIAIEKEIIKKGESRWIKYLGELEERVSGEFIIRYVKEGILKNFALIYKRDGIFVNAVWLFPTIYEYVIITKNLLHQRILAPVEETNDLNIVSCFFGRDFICINRELEIFNPERCGLLRKKQLELMNKFVYIDTKSGKVVGVGDLKRKRLLTPLREKYFLKLTGMESYFNLDNFYAKTDLDWLSKSYSIFRISDWDQIYIRYFRVR
ncbi:MAG: hypothetical protein ACP6IP_05335 [Candidatus Njordarchaeia archaeon]